MLYTPVPGTPLYQQMREEGRLLENVDLADIHGQFKFNFKHTALSREDSKRFLDWAFWRDFERNGPSLYRMCRTMLKGWRRYKYFPDSRVRRRFANEMTTLSMGYNAALWAMEKKFRSVNAEVAGQIRELRKEIGREFGLKSQIATVAAGPFILWSAYREEERLAHGKTYEPPTFVERTNWPAKPARESCRESAGLAEPATAYGG